MGVLHAPVAVEGGRGQDHHHRARHRAKKAGRRRALTRWDGMWDVSVERSFLPFRSESSEAAHLTPLLQYASPLISRPGSRRKRLSSLRVSRRQPSWDVPVRDARERGRGWGSHGGGWNKWTHGLVVRREYWHTATTLDVRGWESVKGRGQANDWRTEQKARRGSQV